MARQLAVIDLGSNTFHLLIVNAKDGSFEEVHRHRIFVGLAEGGIDSIKDTAIQRAKQALVTFKDTLEKYDVSKLSIIGTAALRSASNASLVDHLAKEILGQPIQIIEGLREAELIYKGVSQLIDCSSGDHMIMDIGGGSTEFIVISDGKPYWSQSFNIGVAVLHELFHKSNPISDIEISNLNSHLDKVLAPLQEVLKGKEIKNLIGASGSFEVVVSMSGGSVDNHKVSTYDIADFNLIAKKVIPADFHTRAAFEGMPKTRVKLIVVAFVLLDYVLKLTGSEQITVSPYALKEGVLGELL